MQLRLRTKLTLVMTGLVLLVAAVLSGVFAAQLLDQMLQATKDRAGDLAGQVFLQAQHSLTDAGQQGLRPASDSPQEIHDYVRHAFEIDEGLHTLLKAAKENPLICGKWPAPTRDTPCSRACKSVLPVTSILTTGFSKGNIERMSRLLRVPGG